MRLMHQDHIILINAAEMAAERSILRTQAMKNNTCSYQLVVRGVRAFLTLFLKL